MDLVAVLIALAAFALLVAAIEALDRVWAPRTSSGCSCRPASSRTCSTRCCGGSGS